MSLNTENFRAVAKPITGIQYVGLGFVSFDSDGKNPFFAPIFRDEKGQFAYEPTELVDIIERNGKPDSIPHFVTACDEIKVARQCLERGADFGQAQILAGALNWKSLVRVNPTYIEALRNAANTASMPSAGTLDNGQ